MTNIASVDYGLYIHRVMYQVHPSGGITKDACRTTNALLCSVLRKIMTGAVVLSRMHDHKTLTARDIQTAVRLVLPGQLAQHAVREATKACTQYNQTPNSTAMSGPILSRQALAGLQFPVARTENIMVQLSILDRKSGDAAVYLTAVIDYICAELMELAGNNARDAGRKRITVRHIKLAILNDEELAAAFDDVVMAGGVMSNIHSEFLPKVPDPSRVLKTV